MTLREFLNTWYGAGLAGLLIVLAASAANGLMQGKLF